MYFVVMFILFILILGMVIVETFRLIINKKPEFLKDDLGEIEVLVMAYDSANITQKIQFALVLGGVLISTIFHNIVNIEIRKKK